MKRKIQSNIQKAAAIILIASVVLSACGKKNAVDSVSMNDVSANEVSENEVSENTVSKSTVSANVTVEEPEEVEPIEYEEEVAKIDYVQPTIVYKRELAFNQANHLVSKSLGEIVYPMISFPENKGVEALLNQDIQRMVLEFKATMPAGLTYTVDDSVILTESSYADNIYGKSLHFRVARNQGNVLSFEKQEFNGKDFPDEKIMCSAINYDLTSGQKITLEQLVSNAEEAKKLVENYILDQSTYDAYKEVDSKMLQKLVKEDLFVEGKWYLSGDGIHFYIPDVENNYAWYTENFVVPYEEFKMINDKYRYSGNYQRMVLINQKVKKDLNGDKIKETIKYTNNGSMKLKINGKDYTKEINTFDLVDKYYAIVDIDQNDSYIELAILDYGPSADDETVFYRFEKDGTLTCLGDIFGVPGFWGDKLYLVENGIISSEGTLNVVQTWLSDFRYTISGNEIVVKEADMYYTDLKNNQGNALLVDIYVYDQMNSSAKPTILKANDGPVLLVGTDNKEWLMIRTKDNKIKYVLIKDGFSISTPKGDLESSAVFADLVFYG